MKIKKPFADKIADILQTQNVLAEHSDPLRAAVTDQLLDRLRSLQVKRLQTQQTDIARVFGGRLQGTAVDVPADRA
ncbi:hypothetical protein CFT9_27126 [Pseudomonas sp. CFT9]|nr:hypothetical protein CFT9_27126 [Pseudomonas sp. CFT9]